MKTVKDLNAGDICYWFNEHGEFKGEVKVESIKDDDDIYLGKGYYIKIKEQGVIKVRENETYGDSIDFPNMIAFFSKEAAVEYFISKIEERISTFKNSIANLYS